MSKREFSQEISTKLESDEHQSELRAANEFLLSHLKRNKIYKKMTKALR